MCGLTAFLAIGGDAPSQAVKNDTPLEKQLDDSLELVKHRGPDARGQWISPDSRVGLGHVRLSIIDLSAAGNQPFHDEQGSVHAVVNGELYDHEMYRAELADEYSFKSHSDCEIVIGLYKKYGLSFVSKLRGEFALVLWDAKRQLFFAARDRYGVKSLYYTMVGNRLVVATEMKSFLPFGWEPEWWVQTLRNNSWTFGSRTYLKDVYRVEPGHYLVSRDFMPPEVRTYYDLDYPNKKLVYPETTEETILRVRELLLESVRLRLRADVGVGIYLSGGLDSSAIAGMVKSLLKEGSRLGSDESGEVSKMSCFTVQFDKDSGMDESEIAQRTAEWLGADFHPIHMNEEALAARLEDTVWHSETPIPNVNGLGRLAMAEAAHAKGLKVILTGEGSDEHFAGYPDFVSNIFVEPDHAWPESVLPGNAFIENLKIETVKRLLDLTIGKDDVNILQASQAKAVIENTACATRVAHMIGDAIYEPWTGEEVKCDSETAFAESLSGQVIDKMINKWHPLHTAEYSWTKTILVNYILRYLGDNVDMVYQIETRPPFLDHHVTEYANNIPPSLKMKYNPVTKTFREKDILREAMKPYITEEIYNRTKHPFLGPSKYKEDGPVHNVLKRLVTEETVQKLGFINWAHTEQNFVRAFRDRNPLAFQRVLSVAQLVVLGQRFGVKTARAERSQIRPKE